MSNNEEHVIKFIETFTEMYPLIDIGYIYDLDGKYFDIFHNYPGYLGDSLFLRNIGIMIQSILYENEVFNISFSYKIT